MEKEIPDVYSPENVVELTEEQEVVLRTLFKLVVNSENLLEIENICELHGAASMNYCDGAGRTPLMRACMHLQLPVVQKLLQLGANPNLRTSTGYLILEGLLLFVPASLGSELVDLERKREIVDSLIANGAASTGLHIRAALAAQLDGDYPPEALDALQPPVCEAIHDLVYLVLFFVYCLVFLYSDSILFNVSFFCFAFNCFHIYAYD
jgi:hypothetical protein